MGKSSGSIWVSLGLKTSEFTKGIQKSKKQLSGFQKFGAGLKNMFNPMMVGTAVVAGLGVALNDAFNIFKDFEKANSDLKAVLGGSTAEMKMLSDQAKALGSSTAFTATEVAGLQKEFAKLGFDSSQIENMTEATLNLAAAAGVELAEAATMAGSTLNAFGLNSADAGHITDVMALSFSSSALDMEKLSETMKVAAPIARATGVSFEVATAAAGKLADANITGSKAGTDLKNIFSALVKDGKPFQQSLNDIAAELNGASTKAEKLAIAEDLVGERAKGALLVLANQKDALGDLAIELGNADGAAKKMADTMLDNLTGDMTIARSAWEGFVLSLEDGSGVISVVARSTIQLFTNLISNITLFNNAGTSVADRWRMVANTLITSLTAVLIPFREILKVIDKVSGTDLASALEVPKFELDTTKISSFESALKKQDVALLDTFKGITNMVNKYKEYGLSTREAQKRTSDLIESMKPMAEEMPKAIGETTKATIKLTTAEEKAALAARNLTLNLAALKDVELGEFNGKALAAFDKLDKELRVKGEDLKDFKLPLRVIPELEFDGLGMEEISAKFDLLQAQADAVGGAVAGAFGNMSNNMIASLGLAESGMDGFVGGMLQTVASLISMMLASSIAQSVAGATASGTATGPAAVFTTPAFIATAVGGVLGAFAAIPAFADGGIVSGPTMGLMGEYSGAKSNPEVIAPLDKLKSLMPQNDGGGGDVNFRIKGTDLVGVLNRTGKAAKYSN